MATPEIRAYLAAREEANAAEGRYYAAITVSQALAGLGRAAQPRAGEALTACLPPRLRATYYTPAERDRLADHFVYFPLLVDQFDGDAEAAEAAWALGARPAGYPEQGGA